MTLLISNNVKTHSKTLRNQKILIEVIWWVFTCILIILVLLPVWNNVPDYPFFGANIFFIAGAVTFTRYIFLLPTTLIARTKWIKVIIIATACISFFVMSTALSDFRNFLDERGLQTLVTHLHVHEQTDLIQYIKREMVFFGVASVIAAIVLSLRMFISLWRMRNRGTV